MKKRVAQGFSPAKIALGFRVKAGYAIAVALSGPASAPRSSPAARATERSRRPRAGVMRSLAAVVAGYLVFGVSSAILFGVSGQDPHVLPGAGFLVCSLVTDAVLTGPAKAGP